MTAEYTGPVGSPADIGCHCSPASVLRQTRSRPSGGIRSAEIATVLALADRVKRDDVERE